MLRTRFDSGMLWILSTRHEGKKHERKVSGCLQNFDHVTRVHLRFEKSCSWRSLFNSGPNSKMSPTQSTCLNHGFKDTLIKLVTKMIGWIYWSHEGNAFCFWSTVSHMLSMRYQNPVPQCWKNLEKPLLDTAGLSKRVYGSWELRKPGKATKVIWKKAGTPDRWKWCRT